MRWLTPRLLCLLVVWLGGCSGTQELRIVFEPRDATVKVTSSPDGVTNIYANQPGKQGDGEYKPPGNAGTVPLTLNFGSSSARYQIAVSREGYRTVTKSLDRSAAASLPKVPGSERTALLNVQLPKTFTVRFQSDPLGAALKLTDPEGHVQLIRSGQEVDLHLANDGKTYKLTATADGFVKQESPVDLQRVTDAMRDSNGVVRVELASEAFVDQRQLMVVYDPRAGFVGKYRNVRAWKQDTLAREKPTRVMDLPETLGLRGMTLTPDARQLVYSLAEVGTPPPSAVDAEDAAAATPVAAVSLKACRLKAFTLYQGRSIGDLPSTDFIDTDPCFLSDAGLTLLFASNGRNRRSTSDILAVSQAAPDELRILQRGTADAAVAHPSGGADGTLAFVRIPNGGDRTSEVMLLDGRKRAIEARPAPVKIATGAQPQVSPDGSRVAYIDRDTGNVMVHENATGRSIALTSKGKEIREYLRSRQPGYDPELTPPYSTPTWSPDGRFILYSGIDALDRNGRPNEDVWVVPATGGVKPTALTNDGSADLMPCWARDNSIYFVSNRGGNWAVYRLAAPAFANRNAP